LGPEPAPPGYAPRSRLVGNSGPELGHTPRPGHGGGFGPELGHTGYMPVATGFGPELHDSGYGHGLGLGPRPGGGVYGPGPGGRAYETGPETGAVGPGPSSSPFGPGPSSSAFGPGPGSSAYGPGPGSSAFGPGPGSSAYGPGPGSSAYGPGPGSSAFGPSTSGSGLEQGLPSVAALTGADMRFPASESFLDGDRFDGSIGLSGPVPRGGRASGAGPTGGAAPDEHELFALQAGFSREDAREWADRRRRLDHESSLVLPSIRAESSVHDALHRPGDTHDFPGLGPAASRLLQGEEQNGRSTAMSHFPPTMDGHWNSNSTVAWLPSRIGMRETPDPRLSNM